MQLIGRIFVILFACLVASFAAGLTVSIAIFIPEAGYLALQDRGGVAVLLAFSALFVSLYALLPLLVVLGLAEAVPIRSVLIYALAGAAIGCGLYLDLNGWNVNTLNAGTYARREMEIMAAAGIVAGFVYWLIAGRNAGRWREPHPPLPPAPPAAPDSLPPGATPPPAA